MNINENILQSLQEECAEVIRAASKVNRFGIDDRYPEVSSQTTQEKLSDEIHDLMGAIELAQVAGIIPLTLDRKKIEAKKEKIIRYQRYSADRGTLT